jgi:hypothetical protein
MKIHLLYQEIHTMNTNIAQLMLSRSQIRNMTNEELLRFVRRLNFKLNSSHDKNRKNEEKNIENYIEKIRRVGENDGLSYGMTFKINDKQQRKNDDNRINNKYSKPLNELYEKIKICVNLRIQRAQNYNVTKHIEIVEKYNQLIDEKTDKIIKILKRKPNPSKHKKIELPLHEEDIFEDALEYEVPVEAPVEAPVEVPPVEAPVEAPPVEAPVEAPPVEAPPVEAPVEAPVEIPMGILVNVPIIQIIYYHVPVYPVYPVCPVYPVY